MRFKRTERRALGGLAILAYISGALLFVMSQFVRISTPVGEQHHSTEQAVRIAHAVLAYGLVLAFGYLVKSHILPGLRSREKRRVLSGFGITALFGVLLVSALVTLYGGDSTWVSAVSLLHGIVGMGCPGLILFHVWRRRQTVSANAADSVKRRGRAHIAAAMAVPSYGKPRGSRKGEIGLSDNGLSHFN